jgi:CRP-like cAMP-binding protein
MRGGRGGRGRRWQPYSDRCKLPLGDRSYLEQLSIHDPQYLQKLLDDISQQLFEHVDERKHSTHHLPEDRSMVMVMAMVRRGE